MVLVKIAPTSVVLAGEPGEEPNLQFVDLENGVAYAEPWADRYKQLLLLKAVLLTPRSMEGVGSDLALPHSREVLQRRETPARQAREGNRDSDSTRLPIQGCIRQFFEEQPEMRSGSIEPVASLQHRVVL